MANMFLTRTTRKCKSVAERFWAKVDKRGPDDCWLWIGKAVANYGYGRLSIPPGKQIRAHRASWEIHNGPIPDDLKVLHKCDNPPCCNPAHLFLGTKKDNTHDAIEKGRLKLPPRKYGDSHHKVTIPDSEIPHIRNSPEVSRVIAERYGVNTKTIWNIKNGKSRVSA